MGRFTLYLVVAVVSHAGQLDAATSVSLFLHHSMDNVCSGLKIGYPPLGACHSRFASCKNNKIREIYTCENESQVYTFDETEGLYHCVDEKKEEGCKLQNRDLLASLEIMVARLDFCKTLPKGVYTAATNGGHCVKAAIFCFGSKKAQNSKVSLCPEGTVFDTSSFKCVKDGSGKCGADYDSSLLAKLLQQYCQTHVNANYCDRLSINCPTNGKPELHFCPYSYIAYQEHLNKPFQCVKEIPGFIKKCSRLHRVCENGFVSVKNCPLHMVFDGSKCVQKVNYMNSYGDCSTENPPTRKCTHGRYYPHPHNCAAFYQCSWGKRVLQHCAVGTVWNQRLLTCVHGNASACNHLTKQPAV